MLKTIHDAGYLLTHSLDILSIKHTLNPIYGCINQDGSKLVKEIQELSLEQSIPKALDIFEKNVENAQSAVLIYPAELEDDLGKRYSTFIVMAQKYDSNEYIILSQPYQLDDSKLCIKKYELLDYYDFLEDDLEELEREFVNGAFEHDNAQFIWVDCFSEA